MIASTATVISNSSNVNPRSLSIDLVFPKADRKAPLFSFNASWCRGLFPVRREARYVAGHNNRFCDVVIRRMEDSERRTVALSSGMRSEANVMESAARRADQKPIDIFPSGQVTGGLRDDVSVRGAGACPSRHATRPRPRAGLSSPRLPATPGTVLH